MICKFRTNQPWQQVDLLEGIPSAVEVPLGGGDHSVKLPRA
jgi:hypothetical protein